jgi:hypothetical protein
MPTRRIPLQRATRWRVSPSALAIWRTILEIQAQPRDRRGEFLSEENRVAERDAVVALAAEMGFCKLTVEPHRVEDEPWSWIHDNQVQMERWALGKQIRDALNAALLAETGRRTAAETRRPSRREPSPPQPEPKAL